MADHHVSRSRAWLLAVRPQTLPAAVAPVVVGTALAVQASVFAPGAALAALIGAALIQVGTNLANDYYDAVKGADTEDRDGFTRVTQADLIPPQRVKLAAGLTFGLAILVGVYLVYLGGFPVVVIGLASVASGWAYTGGPYPLGYIGLGDPFVFVFFGLVAVAGTFYVQAAAVLVAPPVLTVPDGTVTPAAVAAGVPIGALATAVLVINNVRDRETDAAAGKRTVVVRFGDRFGRLEYLGLLGVAYLVPVWLWIGAGFDPTVLAPLASLPIAVWLAHLVWTATAAERLNRALERTGQLLALYAGLFAVGVIA